MSLMYGLLKPIVRKLVKNRVHQEESYEDFVRVSHEIQAKFRFRLPQIRGYEFRDEQIGGFHCIVGHKAGRTPKRALVYFVGGGERRWQLPMKKSMARYMEETDRELFIPLYPLYPDYNIVDEVEMICSLHRRMLERYEAKDIAWLGFSAGADMIMATGRYIVRQGNRLPMPGLMIPVSGCNLSISEESYARMLEIEKRDMMMNAASMKLFPGFYNPGGKYPEYLWGCAAEDDYTGFPRIIMYFGGDEIFAAEAPEYEKAFKRCGVPDYTIHVTPGMFHAYPMFSFLKEGRQGEDEIIGYLKQ
ncbi:MAG: alpha/beta hydrolase [Clostridia bacterium]|nr:alpha/beta hydrolase [Clostridia bacterium]